MKHVAFIFIFSLAQTTYSYAAADAAKYGDYATQVYNCERAATAAVTSCDNAYDTLKKTVQVQSVAATIETTGRTGPGLAQQATAMKNDSNTVSVTAQGAKNQCSQAYKSCDQYCNYSALTPPTEATQTYYDNAVNRMQAMFNGQFLSSLHLGKAGCNSVYAKVMNDATSTQASAISAASGSHSVLKSVLKTAAIVGVVGGAAYLLTKKDKDKTSSEDEANGVITDSNGNKITCFSTDNYTNSECKSTLIALCQGDKADTAGCRSFESYYCANDGNGSNYCLYADTKVYCAQSGSMISSSPGCVWAKSRSSSCKTDPEQVSCLADKTATELTTACTNYPNDPLCTANSSGRVVVKNSEVTTTTSVATTSTVSTASDTSTMSAVIGTTSATSSTSSVAVESLSSSSTNLWQTSATATQKACANGQLVNCL